MTAVVRLVEFFIHDGFPDGTWQSTGLVTWACVEPGVYQMAACLLSCRPLLQRTLCTRPLRGISRRISRTSKTEAYSNLSKASQRGLNMELEAVNKRTHKRFNTLDDDLEALTENASSTGNHSQATGQRDDRVRSSLVDKHRIHVTREVTLQSDERPTSR